MHVSSFATQSCLIGEDRLMPLACIAETPSQERVLAKSFFNPYNRVAPTRRSGAASAIFFAAVASVSVLAGCSSGAAGSHAALLPAGRTTQWKASLSAAYLRGGPTTSPPAKVGEDMLKDRLGTATAQTRTLPAHVYTCSYLNYYSASLYGCQVWSGSTFETQTGIKATWFPNTYGPQGVAVTGSGMLLIADTNNSTVDSMENANTGHPNHFSNCINDAGQYPDWVAATKGATLIVISNIFSKLGSSVGPGSLAVANGCGSTPVVLQNYDDDSVQGIAVAINSKGDCFWTYNDLRYGQGYVAKYTACKGRGWKIPQYGLQDGYSMAFAGGIAFDNQDNMYLNDQTHGIFECSAPTYYSCSEINWRPGVHDPAEDNLGLNFSKDWKYLFWADADYSQICFTPTPVHDTETCVPNTVQGGAAAPYGIALFKPSGLPSI